jgi:hypothetical protein
MWSGILDIMWLENSGSRVSSQIQCLTHWNNPTSRLAIRYQLRSQGTQLSMEDAQILENKRNCLQKLIDMFEHQADTFLLNHQPTDNVPMSSISDYTEYDHADNIDDSRNIQPSLAAPSGRHHSLHTSNSSGTADPISEDISLPLPSSLGWEWCSDHGLTSLAMKEAKLPYGQANHAIHRIWLALGFKLALFCTQVQDARTQRTKTRAWTTIHSIDTTVHEHAQNYSMARDAYLKLQDPAVQSPGLPLLLLTDLQVSTTILGAAQVGQRNKQLPWIWSFGTSVNHHGTWMNECKQLFILESVINTYMLKQLTGCIGSGKRHSLSDGRKKRTAFAMRQCRSLHISMPSQIAGKHGWTQLKKQSLLGM